MVPSTNCSGAWETGLRSTEHLKTMNLGRWIDETVQTELEAAYTYLQRGCQPRGDLENPDETCTVDFVKKTLKKPKDIQILEVQN